MGLSSQGGTRLCSLASCSVWMGRRFLIKFLHCNYLTHFTSFRASKIRTHAHTIARHRGPHSRKQARRITSRSVRDTTLHQKASLVRASGSRLDARTLSCGSGARPTVTVTVTPGRLARRLEGSVPYPPPCPNHATPDPAPWTVAGVYSGNPPPSPTQHVAPPPVPHRRMSTGASEI